MKSVFARVVSEILFWLGGKVSYLMDYLPSLYPVYNKLMGWSFEIQEWAGNEKPWE